ncbi:MAG: 50S ribosomal protein L10 [Deltaproteobacteria bacterium]|nr:50S ribosomal protein L10 [Deltaproteobacteria bacterium]
MKRSEKTTEVQSLKEKFQKSKAAFLAEYRGLKVSEITEIRREVRKSEGSMKVVKNRLVKKALEGGEMNALLTHFKGPLAVTWGNDPVVVAKVLSKYQESFPAFQLKVGILDGRLLESKDVEALAKLPSREELYAKLLGTLVAPATNLARVLNALPQKLARVVDAIAKKQAS